jgi:hypothetical protein
MDASISWKIIEKIEDSNNYFGLFRYLAGLAIFKFLNLIVSSINE